MGVTAFIGEGEAELAAAGDASGTARGGERGSCLMGEVEGNHRNTAATWSQAHDTREGRLDHGGHCAHCSAVSASAEPAAGLGE